MSAHFHDLPPGDWPGVRTQTGRQAVRFSALSVGEKFRLLWPSVRSFYWKTGDDSYGFAPGEPAWSWDGEDPFVDLLA